MNTRFSWARHHANGYEVSTRGDARFSAFNARMPDGRTIEQHYQCDVKGYDPGGTNWRLGKGKPPLKPVDSWTEYLSLWLTWSIHNLDLVQALRLTLRQQNKHVLTDMFATTSINQARALAHILNELEN